MCLLKNNYSFTSAPHLLTKLRLRYLDCLVDIYTEHSHRLRPHRDDFCTFLLILSAKPGAASHAKDLKDKAITFDVRTFLLIFRHIL